MKVSFKITMALVASTLLLGCSKNDSSDDDWQLYDDVKTKSTEISYYHGGWYPAPGRENWELSLVIKKQTDGTFLAVARVPNCKVTGKVPSKRYLELEEMILKAKRQRDEMMGIDRGDETIDIKIEDQVQREYLRSGDSTANKLVIVPQDAQVIVQKIDAMAEAIFDSGYCESTNGDVQGAYLLENVKEFNVSSFLSTQRPTLANPNNKSYSNLKFDLTSSGVVVSGRHRRQMAQGLCEITFQKKHYQDLKLKQALQKIQIVERDVVCLMGIIYPNEPKNIRLQYLDEISQPGFFHCAAEYSAHSADEFVELVDKLLASVYSKCFQ